MFSYTTNTCAGFLLLSEGKAIDLSEIENADFWKTEDGIVQATINFRNGLESDVAISGAELAAAMGFTPDQIAAFPLGQLDDETGIPV